MRSYISLIIWIFLASFCSGDTFTDKTTKETFHGYTTSKTRLGRTLVRLADNKSKYLDLSGYDVKQNFLGRENKVVVIPVKDDMSLECEAAAFETAIAAAADSGPLFIVIEIDTPGGRIDLVSRMCTAISKIRHCPTVAFISGGEYGGAYSGGAFIALACDYLCMAREAAIGAAAPMIMTNRGPVDAGRFGKTFAAKMTSSTRAQLAGLAERAGRPALLAKAMVDKELEVLEVTRDGKRVLVTGENKRPDDSVVRVWSKKGELLSLTASESVQTGIANRSTGSRADMLKALNAGGARVVHNTEMQKARKELGAAKARLEKLANNVDFLAKELITLGQEVGKVDNDYARESQRLDNMIRSGFHVAAVNQQRHLLNQIMSHRAGLLRRASEVTAKIAKAYDSAIALGKRHPDLEVDDASLKRAVNSANVLIGRIQRTP
ncbi:MAG: Clp protease/crotonase-like domain-containing protein [Planctomycetota bacterium]|jgi:hypothetical protein